MKKTLKKHFPNFYNKLSKVKQDRILKKLKRVYPNTFFFPTEEAIKLYSQHNQDYIIYNNFFKEKKDGVFFDVGGNHPLNINNTRYFEEIGWNGYVFEPLPSMQPLWEKHRKAKFFPLGASDKADELTFSVVKNVTGWEDMLSFVKKTRDKTYAGHETEDIIIKVVPLRDVLKKENIVHIDYMSIDVEGHELNVVKGIDFNEVKISVLTIENAPPGSTGYGDDNIRKLMFKNDYILWGRIIDLDDIYVHKDFLNTLEFTS